MAKATKEKKGKVADKPVGPKLPAKKVRKRNQVKKGAHGGTVIVLVEDVAHVGKAGDQVEVKPGYARNYLIPNGYAIIPTPHDLKLLERHQIKVTKARDAKIADLKVLAEQLSRSLSITIEAQANEDGHLYGSIGPVEISKTLKGKNLMVEPEMVKMEHPIKEVNTVTPIPLHLGFGIESSIQVIVVGLSQVVGKK